MRQDLKSESLSSKNRLDLKKFHENKNETLDQENELDLDKCHLDLNDKKCCPDR